MPHRECGRIQAVVSTILDYDNVPEQSIFEKIDQLPAQARPLLYWFLISAPDPSIHRKAASEFVESLKLQKELKQESFLAVSPTLVSQRIAEVTGG